MVAFAGWGLNWFSDYKKRIWASWKAGMFCSRNTPKQKKEKKMRSLSLSLSTSLYLSIYLRGSDDLWNEESDRNGHAISGRAILLGLWNEMIVLWASRKTKHHSFTGTVAAMVAFRFLSDKLRIWASSPLLSNFFLKPPSGLHLIVSSCYSCLPNLCFFYKLLVFLIYSLNCG